MVPVSGGGGVGHVKNLKNHVIILFWGQSNFPTKFLHILLLISMQPLHLRETLQKFHSCKHKGEMK